MPNWRLEQSEVELLRAELIGSINQEIDLSKFGAVATAAGVAAGAAKGGVDGAIIALIPLLVLMALMESAAIRRRNVVRIATYLRAFAGKNFRFELLLREFREDWEKLPEERRPEKEPWEKWPSSHQGVVATFTYTGLVAIVASTALMATAEKLPCSMLFVIVGGVACGLGWLAYGIWRRRKAERISLLSEFEGKVYKSWLHAEESAQKKGLLSDFDGI